MIIIRKRLVLLESPATDRANALRTAVERLAEKSRFSPGSNSSWLRQTNNALARVGLSDIEDRRCHHAPGDIAGRHGGYSSVPKSMRGLTMLGLWPEPLHHVTSLWKAERDRLRLSTPDNILEWYDLKQHATSDSNEFRNHRDAPMNGLGFLGVMFVRMFLPHPEGVLATMNSKFAAGAPGDATFDRLWPGNLKLIRGNNSMKALMPTLQAINASRGQIEAISAAVTTASRRDQGTAADSAAVAALGERLETDEALLLAMLQRLPA